MCWAFDRWGELDEIRKGLEEERKGRETAVRELFEILEAPVSEPALPVSG